MAREYFRVTYEIVTPESVEDGEAQEIGYASPGGWKHDDPADMDLRAAIGIVGRGTCEDGGRAFYTVDPDLDYRTGEHTSYAVHPPENITRASYARVRRILCGR